MQAFVRLFFLAAVTAVAQSSALRPRDPSLQSIPSTGQKDNTFNNGAAARTGELPDTGDTPPDIYGARSIDLPFNRLYSGDMKFFPAGQLNTPDQYTDVYAKFVIHLIRTTNADCTLVQRLKAVSIQRTKARAAFPTTLSLIAKSPSTLTS